MRGLPSDVAIRVRDVHKSFKFSRNSEDSFKHKAITLFHKKDKRTKGADYNHALKGISFDVKKGEFLGLVGRNGTGKSTLLKIIAKIYQPTSGTSDYQGKLVAFINLGVGFNPQLSGRDNVYLNAAMLGFTRQETDTMYDDIVEFAELWDFMNLDLKNYSSGMKVRLAFSIAIRAKADILILDEVLAVGDAAFKKKCYQYFNELKEEHKTIILVSHSMGLVKQYCDRAIMLEAGHIAHDGDAESVADAYNELFSSAKDAKNLIDNPDVELVDRSGWVSKGKIHINIKLRSKRFIENVALVVRIQTDNRVLAGVTSADLGTDDGIDLTPNKDTELSVALDNNIGSNDFYVSVVLRSQDGLEKYGRWNKVLHLENKTNSKGMPVNMTGKLEVR